MLLNIQTEKVADHQMKVTVSFESDTFEGYKQRAAKRISRDKKIPGFRPGKAPYDVIRRNFGDEAIEAQAIDLLIDEEYPKILDLAEIHPAAPGSVEDIPSKDPLTLILKIPLDPEVILGDYQTIRMQYTPPEITDQDVDQVLREMRYNYATAETSDAPAQMEDVVVGKVTAVIQDPSEGQPVEYLHDSRIQVLLSDSDVKEEQPFPGFSKNLVGAKPGAEIKFKHKFGKSSNQGELKGKTVEYTVIVETIRKLTLPELNDEFALSLGEFNSVEKLREEIRDQLEHDRTAKYDDKFFDEAFDTIIARSSIAYSPQTLDEEVENVLTSITKNLESEGLDLTTYLKTRDMEQAAFLEQEIKPVAKKRLEQSLVMEEIARKEDIKVEDGLIQNTFQETLQILESSPDFKKRGGQEMRRMASRLALSTANKMLNKKVFDRVKEIVTGQDAQTIIEPLEPKKAKRIRKVEPTGEKSKSKTSKGSTEKKTVKVKKVDQGASNDNP